MAFNFGGFAGGFSQGFEGGTRIGKTIRDVLKEKKQQDMLEKAQAEAGAAFDAQQVAASGLPPKEVDTTAPTSGPVDGKVPTAEAPPSAPAAAAVPAGNPYDPGDTRTDPPAASAAPAAPMASPESAAASEAPPSVSTQSPGAAAAAPAPVVQATPQATPTMPTPQAAAAGGVPGAKPAQQAVPVAPTPRPADPAARSAYIQKEMGKRAYDYFVSQGDIETAEKWLKHSETAAARSAMKDWAKAYTAPDFEGALNGFGKYYTDHVNDGVDYKGAEIITKEDGTQVGIVTLKDKATGKESKMEMTRERILQMAEANNPAALYKAESQRAADAAKAKAKADERKFKIDETIYKEDRADQREGIKATNTEKSKRLEAELDNAKVGKQERAKINLKIEALKAAGWDDDRISAIMPRLIGADDYKKVTDPGERRALIMSDLTKNDPTFARLPEAEQRTRVDQAMRVVGETETAPSGKPAPAASSLPPEGAVFRDKQNPGRLFKNVGGKIVDAGPDPKAQPPAAGPAGGMPKPGGATGGW